MNMLSERYIQCPQCGHWIPITLDASNGDQEFYEECPACCNAIHINMQLNQIRDKLDITIDADDEQIF